MTFILKGLVPVGANLETVEAIEWDGMIWLAPQWQVSRDGRMMKPLWLVPVVHFGFQAPGPDGHDFLLTVQVPGRLLHGPIGPSEVQQFGILQEPSIVVPHPI